MTEGTPEALTAKGMAKDLAATIVFLLGAALIKYIKRHFEVESGLTGTFLLLSDLTLMCFTAGYALHAANYLWSQVSSFIAGIVNDPNLPKLKAAATWAFGGALRAWRYILNFVFGALAAVIVVVILWAAVLATLHHYGIQLAPLLAKLDKLFGQRALLGLPPTEPQLPTPVGSEIVFATVLGLVIATWLIRGVSYVVQRRSHPLPA